MYYFATTLIAGIIAAVLVSGAALAPTPAEAAKLSNAERAALQRATVACKAEAKARKFSWHWLKRRKYVQNCIIRTVKGGISINIWQVHNKWQAAVRHGSSGANPVHVYPLEQVVIFNAGSEAEIDTTFAKIVEARPGALLLGADPFFNSRRDRLWPRATPFLQSTNGVNSRRLAA